MVIWRSGPNDRATRVVIAAVRSEPYDAGAARVDPATLIDHAAQHGVAALALDTLVGLGADPTGVLAAAAHEHRLGARVARSRAERVLGEVADCVDRAPLVLKGPALAVDWYRDPDHREFGDLDLLVRRPDFSVALDRLTAAGFDELAGNWDGFRRAGVAEFPLERHGLTVDLHWHPIALACDRAAFTLAVEDLFERARTVTIGSSSHLTLDVADTLVHLCINVGLDGGRSLRGLVDIDRIVRSGEIDLDVFVDRVRRSRSAALSAGVLRRCAEVLDTPLPHGYIDALAPWRGWLSVNRAASAWRRRGQPAGAGGVGPGLPLAAGRDRALDSGRALAAATRAVVRQRLGAPQPTDPGGGLDWQHPSTATAGDRAAYLAWVDDAGEFSTHRCRDVPLLDELLADLEPRTTPLLGAAHSAGLRGRRCRATMFVREDGDVAAIVLLYRWTVGRATAYPILLDSNCAAAVARWIDRSSASDVAGLECDTEPLRPDLRRWDEAAVVTPVSLPPGFTWEGEYTTTRRATLDDLARVTDLVWRHAPHAFPNRALLRRRVRRAIDEGAFVVDGDDGRPIGVILLDSSTPRYVHWALMVIDPAHRGQGLSWHLAAAVAADASAKGKGAAGFVAESNPMMVPEDAASGESWQSVALIEPRRVRGERRLRLLADRVLSVGAGPQTTRQRMTGRDDDRLTQRRTQQWWRDRDGRSLGEGAVAGQE